MTRFAAPARPRPHDLRLLNRLVERAAKWARSPAGDVAPLARAGRAAMKAVLPPGQRKRDDELPRLTFLAVRLERLPLAERVAEAQATADLAAACRALLEPEPDPPPRRPRADIDG